MKKKLLAILLTVCMVLSMAPAVLAAGYQDIDGHWAEDSINRWSQYGVVQGNNGKFDPYGQMTRGQAAVVFANLLGLEKQGDLSGFSDVADTWYTEALAKCYAAGIILGSGTQMDPNGLLTREQFFTMFGRALGLGEHEEMNRDFHDAHTVSDWAEGYINSLVNNGYVDGMTETTIEPDLEINRASVMALLDKTIATYVTEDGEVEAPAEGGIVIAAAENVTITGEFAGTVIAVGGDTNVTIENATTEAEVIVASGSENVTVSGEFAGTVTVAAPETTVTVENATEDAKVVVSAANTTVEGDIKGTVEVAKGATDTTVAASTGTVAVTGEGASVAVSGTVGTVEVKEEATGAAVEVKEEAKVENLTTNAADSSVAVSGTVEKVEVKETASNTNVTTETTAKVENVTINATGTTVSGTGTVDKVEAGENATGTTVNTSGSKVENNSTEDVTVGTGTVESGSTGTSAGETSQPEVEDPTPVDPTPSTPSTPSGPSEPVHFCSYTGAVTKEATCTETGVKTFTCSCGASYLETIPMVEHEDGVECEFCEIAYATTEEGLVAAVAKGGDIKLMANITLSAYLNIEKTLTLNLNGFDITREPVTSTAIYVNNADAVVTIQGEGTVTGGQAVFVMAGQVDIRGGSYHSDGDTIYTAGTGKVYIYAGRFSADESGHTSDQYCVLNQLDSARETSSITVYGGTFVGFNPADNASEGAGTNFVALGYVATENNGTWTVIQLFEEGTGTEEDPFIINDIDDMKKIPQVTSYAYYKVADGVTTLNGAEWSSINMVGSFDGNGVVINDLSAALFNKVGAKNDETNTYTVKNLTINADITGGATAALIRTAPSKLVIENVDIHGYIEGSSGTASYIVYGAGNNNDKEGSAPFEVTIKNCVSDATLIATGDFAVGFIKHPYSASGSTSIKIVDSAYIGNMYALSGKLKYFNGNGNYSVTTEYSDTFISELDLNPGEVLHSGGKYIYENHTTVLETKDGTLHEKGAAFTVTKVANAVEAIVYLEITPNDTNETGSYLGVYMTEKIDLTKVDGETFSTTEIKYFDITINDTEAGAGLNGNTYNVVNDFYGKTHNGATVRVVQNDADGIAISIITYKIAAATTPKK